MKTLDKDGLDYLVDKIYDTVNSGGSADYIVEQGTSGIWTYRKWASGVAECWGTQRHTVTGWGAWGSIYEGTPAFPQINYPTGLFISYPNVTMTSDGTPNSTGSISIELFKDGTNTKTPVCYIVRPTTLSVSIAYDVHIKAQGLWKEFTPGTSARVNNGYYQATGSSGTLSLANGTITQIPLVSTGAILGGESIFSISDGGIKVSKSGNYRISGSVMAEAANAVYNCGCYIKAGTSLASSSEVLNSNIGKDIANGPQFGIATGSKIITLSENDILYLCVRVQGGTGTAYKQHASTYLLVEKV